MLIAVWHAMSFRSGQSNAETYSVALFSGDRTFELSIVTYSVTYVTYFQMHFHYITLEDLQIGVYVRSKIC